MDAIDLVDALQRKPLFKLLLSRLDELVGGTIADYLQARLLNRVPPSAKAIKDAVWGMIDVSAREIVVLDSPPLQRLHHIRQLGVTYLTYPTAGYSRYEHTLGAMHQAKRMLVAIAARSERTDDLLANVETVRLAALIHDIGHLPFSHVAERFYSDRECVHEPSLQQINQLRTEVQVTLSVPRPRLSECFSVLLTLTPAFRRLLAEAGYLESQVAEAVLSIVGRPPSAERAFFAQVITNVIDADKLDYMFRDAFCTGVPLAVDLERLLFKIRCIELNVRDCHPAFRRMFNHEGRARILGTDLTGQRHAHDLILSRTMLFERVYHHHKTLAAERVVMRILQHLDWPALDLLAEDDRFFSRYALDRHPAANAPYINMLDLRRLPRRGFALSFGFLQSQAPIENGRPVIPELTLDAWEDVKAIINQPISRAAIEVEIAERARQIAALFSIDIGEFEVWVDTAPEPFELSDVELRIERPDGTVSSESSFPADAATFARNPKAMSYVFVSRIDEPGRECVFLATELLLAEKYGLALGRGAADYAKLDWRRIEERKRLLEADDCTIFRNVRAIRPRSAIARRADIETRIREQANRFAHFNTQANVVVNADRIRAYLDQFPDPMVESMVTVLDHVVFLGRAEFGQGFATLLKEGLASTDHCVPLSKESYKSSALLGYFLADHRQAPRPISLEQALETTGDITLYDDCLLSGKQARTIVQTWFGIDRDLDEVLADELTEQQRNSLKSRKVRFRFIYAAQRGIEEFKSLTEQLGLGGNVAATIAPVKENPIEGCLDATSARSLRNYLTGIGTELLRSTKGRDAPEKWTHERCADYALGYGGLGQLLVLAYNTPTATITPLWKGGTVGGIAWLPLFPRRGEASPELLVE